MIVEALFCMTKYKAELKAQIVHEYLSTSQSTYDLSKKYKISERRIAEWVQRYQLSGVDALKKRQHKRTFTTDFKLNVIDYYQTHEESMAEVASRFDILVAQISTWRSQFARDGITALKPHPKGRPSKVKHTKKQVRQLANKSELERLKEELAKKNQELYDTKLERDILKKSLSLFGPSKPERKPK
jgi:transposase